jgi:hypothetical protein
MRTKHSTDESGEKIKKRKVIKRSTENDGFRNVNAIFVDRLLEVKNI